MNKLYNRMYCKGSLIRQKKKFSNLAYFSHFLPNSCIGNFIFAELKNFFQFLIFNEFIS